MRTDYINPFLTSLSATFQTMLNCNLKRGKIQLRENSIHKYPISSVIGLSGSVVGTVVIHLSETVAHRAASSIRMMEINETNEDVMDVVSELANLVAGAAKAELAEYDLSISLPNVTTGSHHDIQFPSTISPICVPFVSDFGPLMLEVGIVSVAEPVAV